jgi:hypothetical protein
MDARDQRDRQQFHEAKIFDAVQAPVLTGSIDAALLHALIEISRSAPAEKCRRPLRWMICAATGVSRQMRGHIDSHKTGFACRDHRA